ncbi:MAG: hypothetical protein WBX15_07520, partial [Thermoanaerobaculia bacterium]
RLIELLRAEGAVDLAARVKSAIDSRRDSLFDVEPLLGGSEIQEITGTAPGPEIGRIKRALIEAQIAGEVHDPEDAGRLVRHLAEDPD